MASYKFTKSQTTTLNAAQTNALAAFLPSIWDGAVVDAETVTISRGQNGGIIAMVDGYQTANAVGELPDAPFTIVEVIP
jgi:hypothetical protein